MSAPPLSHTQSLEELLRRIDGPAEEPAADGAPAGPSFRHRLWKAVGRCFWVALIVALPALVIFDFSRQQPTHAVTLRDDDLHAIVAQVPDLPAGYFLNYEQRIGNDDFVRYFSDPEATRSLLESWGRQGGVSTLLTNNGPPKVREPLQAASAIERYPDARHARQRYNGRGKLFRNWSANPSAVSRMRVPRIGHQSSGGRMYVTDDTGRELVVYSITFRTGSVVADVSTTGLKSKDDRGQQAIRLAKLLDERISTHLQLTRAAIGDPERQPPSVRLWRSIRSGWLEFSKGFNDATGLTALRERLDETRANLESMQESLEE